MRTQDMETTGTEKICTETDKMYMRRCLQLAANGRQNAKPNPMVGAVIVARGRIIGEGYHVRCGEGHAEVNAFAAVRPEDEALLPEATMYVSLEPCSHYGKTPPCADLIVSKGVRRVVVGCVDPFAQVHGRGIARLRAAGISVTVGVLQDECLAMNRRFVTVNTLHRPYIILKWAQSANGLMDDAFRPARLSTPFTQMLVHKLRAECDAILVGHTTWRRDRPRLDVRHWAGRPPLRVLLAHDAEADDMPSSADGLSEHSLPADGLLCCHSIDDALARLQALHLQTLLVEGGAHTLRQFLDRGLYDELRVETAPTVFSSGTRAPELPAQAVPERQEWYDGNSIQWYIRG